LEPTADQPADLIDDPGGETVALDLETLQDLRQPNPETKDLQSHVRPFQQRLPLPRVPGPKQCFQQVVQVALQMLAQDEAVMTGEAARVMTRL
jgi:hypothetical protein